MVRPGRWPTTRRNHGKTQINPALRGDVSSGSSTAEKGSSDTPADLADNPRAVRPLSGGTLRAAPPRRWAVQHRRASAEMRASVSTSVSSVQTSLTTVLMVGVRLGAEADTRDRHGHRCRPSAALAQDDLVLLSGDSRAVIGGAAVGAAVGKMLLVGKKTSSRQR